MHGLWRLVKVIPRDLDLPPSSPACDRSETLGRLTILWHCRNTNRDLKPPFHSGDKDFRLNRLPNLIRNSCREDLIGLEQHD
jgi:hypothetical protein